MKNHQKTKAQVQSPLAIFSQKLLAEEIDK
jgi:hypothetical protein